VGASFQSYDAVWKTL